MTELAVSLNPNSITPGLLGFIVVCIIGIATWFLGRNLAKHLNKLEADHRVEQEATEIEPPGPGSGPAANGAH
jgi:HAMP domain-containing protein